MQFINKLLGSKFLRVIGLLMAFAGAIMAFLYCYGFALRMFFWAALFFTLAFLLRHHARRISMTLIVLVLGGLLLWPIDASLRFPVLRRLYEMTPFGPHMQVYPSPSGHCVAYFYDHGFQDRAYEIRFAHGLEFPGERNSIPHDDRGFIDRGWDSSSFIVEVEGVGVTFIYDERTRTITFPKGQ